MPPKQSQGQKGSSKSSKSGGKNKQSNANTTEGAEEEPLAAVILADSFDDRFSPLTLHRPRCLLPFCGVPMINITLERLLQAQVSRVYVLAKAHADLIRRHIEDLRVSGGLAGMDITVMALPEAACVGHAMQDLDRKEVIRGDFLLVQPDAVGNVDIREMVRIHTQRKKKDREAIMTIGMMQVAPAARNTPPSANPIVAVRPRTNQLLHWHQPPAEPHTTKTSLPFEDLFTQSDPLDPNSSEVELRADLRETGIDVCGIEVPPLFSENFDYQKLRRDFVNGILTSDLLDSRLFLHIAPSAPHQVSPYPYDNPSGSAWGYGARCDSTRAYDGVALDTLAGYTWPLTPGTPAWPGERLESRQACRFIGTRNVDFDRNSTRIGKSTLVSSKCRIGPGSQVEASTLCHSVQIGASSIIASSHLFEGVRVGSGCTLTSCIVGKNVTILDGVTIQAGCLVGDHCTVGPNVTLRAGTRVASRRLAEVRRRNRDGDDDDDENETKEITLPAKGSDARLGSDSVGYLWPALGETDDGSGDASGARGNDADSDASESDSDDSDDEEDPVEAPVNLRHLVIGGCVGGDTTTATTASDDSVSSIDGDSEYGGMGSDSDDDDDDDAHSLGASTTATSATTAATTAKLNDLTLNLTDDTSYEAQAASERLDEFLAEARASVLRAFDEGHTIENASIELKTLRMASNVPLGEVRKVVVELVLERCDASNGGGKTASWLARWGGLIAAVTGSGEEEGREVIDVMQTFCAVHASTHAALFVPLLKKFYNDDIVSDEAIVAWWKSPTSRDARYLLASTHGKDVEGVRVDLRAKAEPVVRWVVESGDSSDEDEDEESSEDDDA